MKEDLERLKQRLPLLEYLQQRHWTACRTGPRQELVGLCLLHQETRPSSPETPGYAATASTTFKPSSAAFRFKKLRP
jgi:hypothetical protein